MSDIFLDTSIQIARVVHSAEKKRKIENQIRNYTTVYTSLIVKQEYKRRLLKEAQYLLYQLERLKSIEAVLRHVVDHLSQNRRKQNICLQLVTTIFEDKTEKDKTDRAKSTLRNLIRLGLSDFEYSVHNIIEDSGCACARTPIIEEVPYKKYNFGPEKCHKARATCDVIEFLRNRKSDLQKVLVSLQSLPSEKRTQELKRAEKFIEQVLSDFSSAPTLNGCLKVGDLMIAMESVNVESFYSMNIKESLHICRALDQSFIYRPSHAEKDDTVFHKSNPNWDVEN
jgi:hypothetical protein